MSRKRPKRTELVSLNKIKEAETLTLDVGDETYTATLDLSILDKKEAQFPYLHFRPYRIAPCALYPKGCSVFRCLIDGCLHLVLEVETSVNTNLKKHLKEKHYAGEKYEKFLERSSKPERQGNSIEEYVLMITRSRYPYYAFTDSKSKLRDDLQRYGMNVCSPTTFRKALHAITYETVRNMFEKIRGLHGHIMSDATPSKRKNEYVDFCVSMFDAEDRFRVVCLGSKQVQGPLDIETYKRHIITVGDSWGARFSSPGSSMIPGEINVGSKECTEFLLVSSCSDMGPGAHGAFRSLFGDEGHIPCMGHGANGINRDAVEFNEGVKDAYTRLEEALKSVSETQRQREILRSKNIPVPPKSMKIRWNSRFKILTYYLENVLALEAAFPSVFKPLDFDTLRFLHAILQPLASFIDAAQTVGPCDTLFLPIQMLAVLRQLDSPSTLRVKVRTMAQNETKIVEVQLRIDQLASETRSKWSQVNEVRKAIIRKILRRFFCGEFIDLEDLYSMSLESSVRKWNIFANDFILASFACAPSPYNNFQFLKAIGLVQTDAQAKVLEDKAKGALQRFVARIEESTGEVAQESSAQALDLPLADVLGGCAEEWQLELSHLHRGSVAGAFNDLLRGKGVLKYRDAYMAEVFKVIPRQTTMGKIVRILFSKLLTTVKCETNFGLVQGLLSSARLNLGTKTLAGYYMVNLNPDWVKFSTQAERVPMKPLPSGQAKLDQFFGANAGNGILGKSYADLTADDSDENQPQVAPSSQSLNPIPLEPGIDEPLGVEVVSGQCTWFLDSNDELIIDESSDNFMDAIFRTIVTPAAQYTPANNERDAQYQFEEDALDFLLDDETRRLVQTW